LTTRSRRAVANGFGRVGDQIHDDLLDLTGVDIDEGQPAIEADVEHNNLGNAGAKQVGVLLDEFAQIYAADIKTSLPE